MPAHRRSAVTLADAAMVVEAQTIDNARSPARRRRLQLVDKVHDAGYGPVERQNGLKTLGAPRPYGPANVRSRHMSRPPLASLELEALAARDSKRWIGCKRPQQLLEVIRIHRHIRIELHHDVDGLQLRKPSVKCADDRLARLGNGSWLARDHPDPIVVDCQTTRHVDRAIRGAVVNDNPRRRDKRLPDQALAHALKIRRLVTSRRDQPVTDWTVRSSLGQTVLQSDQGLDGGWDSWKLGE